jgi:hypothetical protein
MRSLLVAGAIVLAGLPPAVTLGAPTAVGRGAAIAQPPPPRAAAARSADRDFQVPFHLDMRPKPAELQAMVLPYRWHAWQYSPQYLWNQSAWDQNGCFANNLFGVPSTLPSDGSVPGTVTIGSLVDDKSKSLLSSTPSYAQSLPSTDGAVVSLQPTSCGSARSISF